MITAGKDRTLSRLQRPVRVFIGLTEVAGYYSNLEKGLRQIGVEARFFDTSGNPSQFGRLGLFGAIKRPAAKINAFRGADSRSVGGVVFRLAAGGHRLAKALGRLVLFPFALAKYDVFIFHGLDSFLGYRDLPMLKKLGKRVIYVFNGSDHRPPYLNGKWVREIGEHPASWLAEETRRTASRVARIEKYADCIVALSASAQFHQLPFAQFDLVGIPFEEPTGAEPDNQPVRAKSGPVRILHSPTDPRSKGSGRIFEAVERLRAMGHEIEYVEIAGRPNAEVLAAIRHCDFVVDQVWSDSPMAGFATEAAYFGKPSVVSGYIALEESLHLSASLAPPSLLCAPNDLQQAIERLVTDPAFREELGARARDYVRQRWAPKAVAKRFLRIIEGDVPAEWLCDPKGLRYVFGWGLPEEEVGEGVRAVVQNAGVSGLAVTHNPELEARLLSLARDVVN